MNIAAPFSLFAALFATVLFLGFLLSFPLMLLWNWCLVPAIPGLVEVGWLQMWGIYILGNFMFKASVKKD
jgi:hypothetical protein